MNSPPTDMTGGTPVEQIGNLIRYWVHYDNKLAELNKELKTLRATRNKYEADILQKLRDNNIMNPVIQTGAGRLIIGEDKHSAPLTFANIETLLHKYYTKKQGRDETADIIKFIKENRETTVTPYLKRQGAPKSRGT